MNSLAKRVKELLQQNTTNTIVQRCFDALSDEASLALQSTGPLPIQHVRRTLTIRAKINAEGSGLVEGFDDTLKALNTETDESVQVYFFDGDKDSYTILTNTSTTKLLGALISKGKGRIFTTS